ncbi:DMT family transporter [Geopsychrobacter electrodiphilus]|uniref:DMT family transporter n=1 Tax=Geopsychrobacter electrodiphilus TaxID=225196 RepID=UPI000368FEE3|nr:DMT family transporter [Geopsychrobacter electrodiphilus]
MSNATDETTTKSFGPYLLLILPPIFWAGNVVLARGLSQQIPPMSMSFLRWAGALLFLAPFTWRQLQRDRHLLKGHWTVIWLCALFGIASFNSLLYTATQTTTALNCALMQTLMPAAIIFCGFLLNREKVSLQQGAGVLLCSLGAVWIVLQGKLLSIGTLRLVSGDLWMLVAVFCYALYSTLLPRRPRVHPFSFLLLTIALGTLMLIPPFVLELIVKGPPAATPSVFGGLLYIALFPSIAAYICWNRGVEIIGANRAGLFINLIPVFAAGMAILFLGEEFKRFHLIGILMVLGGMVLFQLAKKTD